MPICPMCGGKRVDRYCAKCGAVAGQAPPPRAAVYSQAISRPEPQTRGGALLATAVLCVIAFVALGLLWTRVSTVKPPAPPVVEVAKSGYARQLQDQATSAITVRQKRYDELTARYNLLNDDITQYEANRPILENFARRLEQARAHAEEEDRWPVQVGGRSFERVEAELSIARINRYIESGDRALPNVKTGMKQADTGIKAAQQQINEMQNLKRAAIMQADSPAQLRIVGDQIAAMSGMLDRLPEPLTLGVSRASLQKLDVDTLGH